MRGGRPIGTEYDIQLAREAWEDLARMPADDGELVNAQLERGLGAPGREYLFGVVVVDGVASPYWRTYEIAPYTAIFRFMTARRHDRHGRPISAHLVAAIPTEDRLCEVKRRLYEQARPDDSGWD